jgi:hypothetical protein
LLFSCCRRYFIYHLVHFLLFLLFPYLDGIKLFGVYEILMFLFSKPPILRLFLGGGVW